MESTFCHREPSWFPCITGSQARRSRRGWLLGLSMLAVSGSIEPSAQAAGPEPAGWFAGDMHVHRSCGSTPESLSSLYSTMVNRDLNVISLLADMGNGEVQNAAMDLPLVTGEDASISTPGRIIHWDAEWHWDATYAQYPHQALGGHIVALGLTNGTPMWSELTSSVFDWAHRQGALAGFAHFEYLDDAIPARLTCCTPIDYPGEIALGACDFISEDVNGGDVFLHAYYRLLNCGFRPGFAAGSDHPCGAEIGRMLTYSRCVDGNLTYQNWLDGIRAGRTVVSRNGRAEFVDLLVDGTNGPGDEIQLTEPGVVTANVRWTSTQSFTGWLELVQNGVVIARKQATATEDSPVSLSVDATFTKSGWLCARRMNAGGHTVHTAAVFVSVNRAPVRASATDARFFVDWMDTLIQNTSGGGAWSSYYAANRVAAQARYAEARYVFEQILNEAGGSRGRFSPALGNAVDGYATDSIWAGGPWINAARFQSATGATVTTLYAQVGAIAGKYKCAIFAGSRAAPEHLLASTAAINSPADGWRAFPLTRRLSLTPGNYYWLAIWSDDPNARVYYSDDHGNLRWGKYDYGDWPAALGTLGGGALDYCICAASGVAPSPVLETLRSSPSNPRITFGDKRVNDWGSRHHSTAQAVMISVKKGGQPPFAPHRAQVNREPSSGEAETVR